MSAAPADVVIKGIRLSPGVAVGRACFLSVPDSDGALPEDAEVDAHGEERRLLSALKWLGERIRELTGVSRERVGPEAAAVFEAHGMMLEDPILRDQLVRTIHRERILAETAVARHLESYEAQLRDSPHVHLQERADDIASLRRRLTSHLRAEVPVKACVAHDSCALGECPGHAEHVLIADELTPSLTLEADSRTVAFVVSRGGPTSHAAILAQGLGMPAVGGVLEPLSSIPREALVVVDGNRGEVVLDPSPERLARYLREGRASRLRARPPVPGLRVLANIDGLGGARAALRVQAEGIGLYRTELEVMAEGRLLTEGEQTERYRGVLDAMAGHPVYIRLLDIGADKIGDWLKLPSEANPALGLRGARLLLAHPEVLRPQARALARAAADRPVHVVYPMVQDAEQLCQLRAAFEAAISDLPPARLSHGAMFEMPSACLAPEALFEVSDFGCVGTNDLIQYLFAADRDNLGMDHRALSRHPVLWEVLARLVGAAREAGRELSICGELAADPEVTRRLMDIGVEVVSTTPSAVAQVREAAARS